VEFHMNAGFDGEMAFRHLTVVLGSYEPKHQHKMGTVAYLGSLWFDHVVNDGVTYA
jgi:hypothetical protein